MVTNNLNIFFSIWTECIELLIIGIIKLLVKRETADKPEYKKKHNKDMNTAPYDP